MNNDLFKIINDIEDKKCYINGNWYYHIFEYNKTESYNIFKQGIKSNFLLKKKSNGGYNGIYYISLSKRTNEDKQIYKLIENMPMFIIDENIKTIHAKSSNKFGSFINSPLPLRTSQYNDEYQVFLKINPNRIKGINFKLYKNPNTINQLKNDLIILKKIVLYLKENNINMPIYDNSTKREINKEKVLQYTKEYK